jgi:hypothetical protein
MGMMYYTASNQSYKDNYTSSDQNHLRQLKYNGEDSVFGTLDRWYRIRWE